MALNTTPAPVSDEMAAVVSIGIMVMLVTGIVTLILFATGALKTGDVPAPAPAPRGPDPATLDAEILKAFRPWKFHRDMNPHPTAAELYAAQFLAEFRRSARPELAAHMDAHKRRLPGFLALRGFPQPKPDDDENDDE